MIYLASPYSHVGPGSHQEKLNTRRVRFEHTLFAQKSLFNFGYPIFSTIIHTHITTLHYQLPTDFGFWQFYNHHMIDLSRAVFVLELSGWEQSAGVSDEIDYANRRAIPVYPIPVNYDRDNNTISLNIPVIPELQTLISLRRPIATEPSGPSNPIT